MRHVPKSVVLPDLKPHTPVRALDRAALAGTDAVFSIERTAAVTGLSPAFIKKVLGSVGSISPAQLLVLLDQDAFGETFVPRSRVYDFLREAEARRAEGSLPDKSPHLVHGSTNDLLNELPANSIKCIVTSPPYWGTRIYKNPRNVAWGDGETCPFGHEQTPEGYVRHTIETLNGLKRVMAEDGSIWWNVMDTFNTRTQIRSNAAEALRAMQGKDRKAWADHECRRYSSGHAFLKDGEQCSIPAQICERASRIGLYVKSVITWVKNGSLPEPQNSRVSRNLEYVIHFTKQRTPYFDKEAYRTTPPALGGRGKNENDRLTDTWILVTSAGQNGHGAQFALALPGRCIALTTRKGDWVLDPFVGSGTTGLAAVQLGRKFVGFDASSEYLELAKKQLSGKPMRVERRQDPTEDLPLLAL